MNNKRLISLLITILLIITGLMAPTVHANGVASIEIPAIGVNAPIVPVYIRAFPDGNMTWDVSGLRMSVGFFDGTAPIGQAGNHVLGGHSEQARGEADVFYNLDQVVAGSEIIVHVDGNALRYQVVNVYRVNFDDLTPLLPVEHDQLTLITCDLDSYSSSTGFYSQRLVIVANRVG
jgi:LPXTG-site transpeptidase (sortase) family protein